MKKKIISILLIMTMLCSTALLTGCGKTLEDYLENDSTLLDQISEQTTNEGLSVKVEKNTLIYTYDISSIEGMTEQLATSDEMVQSLQSTLDQSEETFNAKCTELEENTDIHNIEILVRYMYGKTVIASKVYKAN